MARRLDARCPSYFLSGPKIDCQEEGGMFKKVVRQGRRAFGARSVHGVREHDKGPRTQLAAFFNIPIKHYNPEGRAVSSKNPTMGSLNNPKRMIAADTTPILTFIDNGASTGMIPEDG